MTVALIGWVLLAAFLHALWNALLKKGGDPVLDIAGVWLGGSIVVAPFIVFLPIPAAPAWPLLLLSIVVHLLYYFALIAAYRDGALSVVYPIMRGVAPALVTLSSAAVLGEPLSAVQMMSVAFICIGVLILSGIGTISLAISGRSLAAALATAALIAIYTVIDGKGARASTNAFSYVAWLAFLQGIIVACIALYLRRRNRPKWADFAKGRSLAGGAASVSAYAIVLWAMTQAPIALVATLRETSVLFAVLLGAWMLKENVPRLRWAGAILVVVGVVLLREN